MTCPNTAKSRSNWLWQQAVFFGGGFVVALVVAWIAAQLHLLGWAPLGLISLGIGIAFGAILCAIAATQRVAGRTRLIILAMTLLSILTVLAEHAWLYVAFRREWHQGRAESAEVAMFRPETPWSPAQYFAHELTPGSAVLWALDAVLITAAAVGIVVVWSRRQHPTRHLKPDT